MSSQRPKKRARLPDEDPLYSEVFIYTSGLIKRELTLQNGSEVMKATCTQCSKGTWIVKNPKNYNSTSNYIRHFNRHHPHIKYEAPETAVEKQEAEEHQKSKSRLKQTSLSMFAHTTNEAKVSISYKRAPNEPIDQNIFLKLLVNFILSCNLSLSICDAPTLRSLLEYLNAGVMRVTPQRLLLKMMDYFDESKKALKRRLQEHIKDGSRVSLTMDIWVAANGTSFLGITVHWCDIHWITHARLLGSIPIPPSHSGKNIWKPLKHTILEFGIQDHIISITTDSADPNRIACELLEKFLSYVKCPAPESSEPPTPAPEAFTAARGWVSCLAHASNRSVQDILSFLKAKAPSSAEREEELYSQVSTQTFTQEASHQNALKKVRRIAVKYKRSGGFRTAFSKQCTADNLNPLSLLLDMEVSLHSRTKLSFKANEYL